MLYAYVLVFIGYFLLGTPAGVREMRKLNIDSNDKITGDDIGDIISVMVIWPLIYIGWLLRGISWLIFKYIKWIDERTKK